MCRREFDSPGISAILESKISSTRGGGFRMCRREFDSPGISNLQPAEAGFVCVAANSIRREFPAGNLNRPQFQALFYPLPNLFLTTHGQLELVLTGKFD
jgi:hypothetical protein